MRKIAVSSLSFLALAAVAACSSSPGPESSEATSSALDPASGGATVVTETCPASGGIATLCKSLGVCTGVSASCDSQTRQVFTGTELLPSHTSPASWSGFGGRGRMFADAGLCMLRDLGTSGPIQISSSGGFASAKETIGFLSFDPANKIFKGYRQLHACLPLFGCIDARPQTFTVSEQRNFTNGTYAGSYPIFGEASLQVTADETSQTMSIAPPVPIQVDTPYGVISVTPSFTYSGGDQMVSAAFQNETYGPGLEYGRTDLYGLTPGTAFTSTHSWTTGAGWDSVLALGSRLSSAPWSGSGKRPDSDFTTARNARENAPGSGGVANGEAISVSANIAYKPPISALPAPIQSLVSGSGIDFEFDVYVRPHYDTKFAGELQLSANEEAWWWMDTPHYESISSFGIGTSVAQSSTLSIQAGVDLVLKIDLGFTTVKILDVHPSFDQPVASSGPSTVLGPSAIAQVIQGEASTPYTTLSAWHASYSEFQTLASNGQNVGDPNAYINACLATAPPAKTIPTGTYTQPNPAVLTGAEWPCNVCYANKATTWTDGNGVVHSLPAEAKTLVPSSTTTSPRPWTCNAVHAGCFDMCTWDPATNQMVIAQSGAIFNQAQCMNDIH